MEKKVRWDVRRAPNFLHPLGIFDSYVCLIKNKLFFGTLRRISNLTNLAVTSWAFSWFLSPGLYGRVLYYVFLLRKSQTAPNTASNHTYLPTFSGESRPPYNPPSSLSSLSLFFAVTDGLVIVFLLFSISACLLLIAC